MFPNLYLLGVTDQLDHYDRKEVKILNLFSIIVFVGLFIGATNVVFLGAAYPALIEVIIALCALTVLFLNHKHMYGSAAYLFIIYVNLTILFFNQYYDFSIATYLYYFPLIFCTALLHNPNKGKFRSAIFFSILAASFLVSRFFDFTFLKNTSISAEQNKILFSYNIYFCVFLTIFLVYRIVILLNKQFDDQAELIESSKKDQIIIKNSLKEKEILLAEVQHRVKNNLAVIIGLFNLQRDSAVNEETKLAITEAKNRVLSIAMVHERLFKKKDLSRINFKNYISDLTKEIIRGHHLHYKINLTEELEELDGDITKAVPVGLIVNEAITNALKHAFINSNETPSIKIILSHQFGQVCVKIIDNGVGFDVSKERSNKSLGLSLIESLAEQLDGNVNYSHEAGTTVKLTFPA